MPKVSQVSEVVFGPKVFLTSSTLSFTLPCLPKVHFAFLLVIGFWKSQQNLGKEEIMLHEDPLKETRVFILEKRKLGDMACLFKYSQLYYNAMYVFLRITAQCKIVQ